MLAEKSGITDFRRWNSEKFGKRTPWGSEDEPALVAQVESALEREISRRIMDPSVLHVIRRWAAGETLACQGDEGDEVFLVLDGMVEVELDGSVVTQVGPGTVLGEMCTTTQGPRQATLRAMTPVRVAACSGQHLDLRELIDLTESRRPQPTPSPQNARRPGSGS